MEKTKLVNTNSIKVEKITDSEYVARIFDRLHCSYLHVNDENDNCVGIYHLEDFCNRKSPLLEPATILIHDNHPCDEEKLFNKIFNLSEEELDYIKGKIVKRFKESFVCCSDSILIAQEIMKIIFPESYHCIRYTESIFELNESEQVIFLSFNKIKLYRKAHVVKIDSLIALNNLVIDSVNRTVFYKKYQELMSYFSEVNVGCFYGIIPEKDNLDCLSEMACQRIDGYGKADYEFYEEILGGKDSQDYVACMVQNSLSRVLYNGIYKTLEDCESDYYNVVGGMRVTLNQPTDYKNTVYIFGPCTARGALVSDENTIASILQEKLNTGGFSYIVMNCGVGGGSDLENTYRYVLSLPIKPGDIVILLEEGSFLQEESIDNNMIFRLSDEFNANPLRNEWFVDRPAHCNYEANSIISDAFYKKIIQYDIERENKGDTKRIKLLKGDRRIFENSGPLQTYIDEISKQKFKLKNNECAGAIVMHCNPMTKGHKYLIDKAMREVDYLYIFILSEDKSEISYALRKKILVHETRNYPNIRVIDCGKFMASTMTFPEYFTKEKVNHSRVDATKDILTFCQYVAPALGITKRFVGTEDRDFVTRQYNNQLKIILPMYGVKLYEIERIKIENICISAHTTRTLIRENNWEAVKDMVSEYTYEQITEYYKERMTDD